MEDGKGGEMKGEEVMTTTGPPAVPLKSTSWSGAARPVYNEKLLAKEQVLFNTASSITDRRCGRVWLQKRGKRQRASHQQESSCSFLWAGLD